MIAWAMRHQVPGALAMTRNSGPMMVVTRPFTRIRKKIALRQYHAENGLSVPTADVEIKSGRHNACKLGRGTIITADGKRAWLDSLPLFRDGGAA